MLGQKLNPWLRKVPVWLVYLAGFVPLAVMAYGIGQLYAGKPYAGLGADPLASLEHQTGIWALRFLIAALVVTPLLRITRISLIKFRRAIGLLGFYYAMAHLMVWVWLDHQFAWGALWQEIVKRPYITIGMVAFVILVPLAVTSNNLAVRRMKSATWKRIHWWAYLATALGSVHFVLVVKAWPPEPLIYASIVAVLLGWRAMGPLKKRRRVVAV